MSLFYLFVCLFIYLFFVIAIFFQIDRLEPSFTDSVFVTVSVIPFPDSGFRIPDSGFRIPCFSAAAQSCYPRTWNKLSEDISNMENMQI